MKIQCNNSIQNRQSTAFKANITVVSHGADFYKLPIEQLRSIGQSVEYPWTVKTSAQVFREGFTEGIYPCIAGYIQNGEKGLLFHLVPGSENTKEAILKAFADAVAALREQRDNVSAFIAGGESGSPKSISLHDSVKEILEKRLRIPFSSIWGSRDSYTDLFASAAKQKYVINANMQDGLKIKNLADLKNAYEEVIIDPRDTLVFA